MTHSVNGSEKDELDSVTLCMEDRLRSLGILSNSDVTQSSTLVSEILKGINLDASTPNKKVFFLSDSVLDLFLFPILMYKN